MRALRAIGPWLLLACAATATAGCPVRPMPQRDGGTPCRNNDDCNPAGTTCGTVFLCVQNVCSQDPVVRACIDSSVDAVSVGNCLSWENCNPPGACGQVISCAPNFQCDPMAPRIEVPCPDGGEAGIGDAAGIDGGDASDAGDAGDAARVDGSGGG